MDPGADHDATLAHSAKRGRHELARRGEDDGSIELLRGVAYRPGPGCAKRAGKRLGRLVAAARERKDAASVVHRHLADDVGGRAEAVETDRAGVPGHAKRAVTDQPGAQQRGDVGVRVALGEREAESLVRDGELGEATVDVIPREARRVAEVLGARQTEAALAARPAEPRHPDSRPDLGDTPGTTLEHLPHDLVTGDEWQVRPRQLAVHDVEIGAADTASAHAEQQLTGRGRRVGELRGPEPAERLLEHHCPHRRHGSSAMLDPQP